MEDAHSVANSLTWGPDGWLYGLPGKHRHGQDPRHRVSAGRLALPSRPRERFELFCEGGGNIWGLDFDRHGKLFASTNVGGFVMLHAVQGGYYWKSFGKHGPLHNPYAFGYFDHVRTPESSGGHVTVGGLFYEADALPAGFRGQYIAADLLGHSVHAHEVTRLGSTFQARQVGDVLRANDTWFAPSDLTLGPDGALMSPTGTTEAPLTLIPTPTGTVPTAESSRSRRTARTLPEHERDLNARSNDELVMLLSHANVWYRPGRVAC